ncbi:hypothetical protein DV737_g168, partial [Chaetothyriales sp. CBS 132003]
MAGQRKNRFGLAIDSTCRVHKKYLGDPNDPHYVPDSPLIERQHLSELEETELKRLCAIALARVPHSDAAPDDPFKYLGPYVQRKSASVAALRPPPQTATHPKTKKATHPKRPAPVQVPLVQESSGSSNSSEVDRTDYSTPLTSAGITPGETNKRFSDALKRPSNSIGASVKYKIPLKTKSRAASTSQSRPRKSADTGISKISKESSSTNKQSIILVQEDTPYPWTAPSHSATDRADRARLSQVELNKQLPPLPAPGTVLVEKPSINRLFKSIKKAKSSQFMTQPASFASADPMMPKVPEISTLKKSATHPAPNAAEDASPHPPILADDRKQRRFRFSKFFPLRKESSTPVTVPGEPDQLLSFRRR